MPPRAVLPCLALAFALSACRPATPPPDAPFRDDLDRLVAVEAPVQRVVPLAPNLTELLLAMDLADRIVAVSQSDVGQAAVADRPRFNSYPLEVERVATYEASLLLANSELMRPETVAPLTDAGIPTYFLTFDALDDIPRAWRTLDSLFATTTGRAAADRFEATLAAYRAWSDTLRTRPSVLLLIGDETLYAYGGDSYTTDLIHLAGGTSTTAGFDGVSVTLSEEQVLTSRPDVIVMLAKTYDPATLLARYPTWHVLPAARTGRIVSIDPDLIVRAGPRLLDGLAQLRTLLHPQAPALPRADATASPDIDASSRPEASSR